MDFTSIVIVTCNQLEYTRRCVGSISDCTPEPYELVAVDNGSSDGTVDFLKAVGSGEEVSGRRLSVSCPCL
jgi:GT2 family glycosyltransferase